MFRVLAFFASMAVPSVVFAAVYVAQGENPLFGLVAGVIGLLGALAYEVALLATASWAAEHEVAAELRRQAALPLRALEDPPDK